MVIYGHYTRIPDMRQWGNIQSLSEMWYNVSHRAIMRLLNGDNPMFQPRRAGSRFDEKTNDQALGRYPNKLSVALSEEEYEAVRAYAFHNRLSLPNTLRAGLSRLMDEKGGGSDE